MKTITIAVSHNIFLTRNQRYDLLEGRDVEVIGVSVPVWFVKGKTTEPANEVFCKYKLTNIKTSGPINTWDEGYTFNILQPHEIIIKPKNEDFSNPKNITSNTLKDISHGGSEWLHFKQYTDVHKNNIIYKILHFVEIKDIKFLEESLS